MAEYTPLTSTSPTEHHDEDYMVYTPPEPGNKLSNTHFQTSTTFLWLTILIAFTTISAAAALYIVVQSVHVDLKPLRSAHDITAALQMVLPSPNLDKGRNIIHQKNVKRPKMKFPLYMVRTSAVEPDRVYQTSKAVVLSSSDSMFYHWKTKSAWRRCYIAGWVSPPDRLVAGGKSYSAEGDVTAIEIWNVSAPADRRSLKSMSWNTRPQRLSLMGTVNFTSQLDQKRYRKLTGQQLKLPTPLFNCKGDVDLTVEVTCSACRLEFDQIFSDPPLGFELIELG